MKLLKAASVQRRFQSVILKVNELRCSYVQRVCVRVCVHMCGCVMFCPRCHSAARWNDMYEHVRATGSCMCQVPHGKCVCVCVCFYV